MKIIFTSLLCLLALLAARPGALLADGLPVMDIPPAPTPAQVKAAKQAFDQGSIVAMKGGTTASFEALLNVAMPQSNSRHRQPPACVQAVRKLPSGRVRKFLRLSRPFAAQDESACEVSFSKWVTSQSSLGDDAVITNWTHVEDLSLSNAWNSAAGNSISLDLAAYRANTIDPDSDYYLVLYSVTLVPTTGSEVGTFPFTIPALINTYAQYQNGLFANIYGFGPQSGSNGISVGQGISFDQNATGIYTASANISPYSSGLVSGKALAWTYLTSGPLDTYQTAAIYKFPSGTTHLTLSTAVEAAFNGDVINPDGTETVLVPISAPQVLVPELTFAMEGAKSSFEVSVSPYLRR